MSLLTSFCATPIDFSHSDLDNYTIIVVSLKNCTTILNALLRAARIGRTLRACYVPHASMGCQIRHASLYSDTQSSRELIVQGHLPFCPVAQSTVACRAVGTEYTRLKLHNLDLRLFVMEGIS
jgi:hypothetical protein